MRLVLMGLMGLIVLVSFGVFSAGYRINISESLPKGIWKIRHKEFSLGSFVLFCPPQDNPIFQQALERGYLYKGFCPGNYAPLIKKVVALYPDVVTLKDQGLWVNGEKIPGTKPLRQDAYGHALPFLRFQDKQLTEEEVILAVPGKAISFDSRYFGAIAKKYIIGEIDPVFIFESIY